MNCKPGDLAVIIKTWRGHSDAVAVGRVLRIADTYKTHPIYGHMWSIVKPVEIRGQSVVWVADEILRPIRDPGDDAPDESNTWLPPVPSSTKEAA